jgi:predicted alpha/beta hydrolase
MAAAHCAQGGHSLGGHLSTIYAGQNPDRLQGVVHIACGSPYFGDHSAATAFGVKLACNILPVFEVFPGYFPGELLGFAGRESMSLMRDWSDWARTGKLDYGRHQNLQSAVTNFQGAVLAISMAGDKLSSLPAEQRAIAPFSSARAVRQVRIGDDESGDHPGHFAWAKEPQGTARAVLQWLQEEMPG